MSKSQRHAGQRVTLAQGPQYSEAEGHVMQAKQHELLGFVEALEECMHGKKTSNGAAAPLVRTAADIFPHSYHHCTFHL